MDMDVESVGYGEDWLIMYSGGWDMLKCGIGR